jgi:predicted kinase
MDLVILMGLQASGKTTFRELSFPEYVVVSKDLMGRSRKNKGLYQEWLIRVALSRGHSVVVDNTNPSLEDRAGLIRLGREYGVNRVIGYYLRSTVQQSIVRNERRTGKALVPRVGILGTAKRFVTPTKGEGFDEFYEVIWGPDRTFIKASVS